MTRRIVRTRRADEDLIDIWQSIADDEFTAADRILDAIDARCQQLLRHPFSGPEREDIGRGMRHLVAGHYIILYRVESECIRVVRPAWQAPASGRRLRDLLDIQKLSWMSSFSG